MEECNRVSLFHKGEIVKTDSPENIFKDKNLILSSGLKFPLTAKLYHALKDKGIEIQTNLKAENFINAVAEYYRGKKS